MSSITQCPACTSHAVHALPLPVQGREGVTMEVSAHRCVVCDEAWTKTVTRHDAGHHAVAKVYDQTWPRLMRVDQFDQGVLLDHEHANKSSFFEVQPTGSADVLDPDEFHRRLQRRRRTRRQEALN